MVKAGVALICWFCFCLGAVVRDLMGRAQEDVDASRGGVRNFVIQCMAELN